MKFYNCEIDIKLLPKHIAIIMDGNGRWAKKRNLERIKGHEKGYKTLKKLIEYNKSIGIKYITVYAFSTENWQRPKDEVNFLMLLAKNLVMEYTETLLKNDIRLMITGIEDNLSEELIHMLRESVDKTSNCKSYTLNIAFNYGGRREITDAAKKIALDLLNSKIKMNDIQEEIMTKYLYQPQLPDVDLLIRTSGELRISNLLLWQSAYAELWFTKKLWPDFGPKDFCKAIFDYQKRNRRFGGVNER